MFFHIFIQKEKSRFVRLLIVRLHCSWQVKQRDLRCHKKELKKRKKKAEQKHWGKGTEENSKREKSPRQQEHVEKKKEKQDHQRTPWEKINWNKGYN